MLNYYAVSSICFLLKRNCDLFWEDIKNKYINMRCDNPPSNNLVGI